MYQNEKWLKIFRDEIKKIKEDENDQRFFILNNYEEADQSYKIRFRDIPFTFQCSSYNSELIEIHYKPSLIIQEYLQNPLFNDEILKQIFKFLAHHEYGHSLLGKSRENVEKVLVIQKENSIKYKIYWLLLWCFKEFFADLEAKNKNPMLPNRISYK